MRSPAVPFRRLRVGTADRFVPAVLCAYLAARALSAILLVALTRYQVPVGWTGPHVSYATIVGLWDAGWYADIATQGYPAVLPHDPVTGELQQNPWAFYPLFPLLTRALMMLTGAPFAITGAMLSLVLGAAAAVVIARLLRRRVGARTALAAVIVWSTCAPSPVLQVAYTESLAILLLTLVLAALDRQRWWSAAGFAVLTGLARPIAVPLGLVALVAVVVRWRGRAARPIPRGEYAAMAAALGGCGVAGLTWPALVWAGTGIRTAYTDTMATWRAGQDIVPLTPWVGISRYLFGDAGPLALAAVVVLILAVALGPWAARLGPVLRAWVLAYPFYLALVLDPGTSLFRYLLPCFPWAVIAVDGAWRARGVHAREASGDGGTSREPCEGRSDGEVDAPSPAGVLPPQPTAAPGVAAPDTAGAARTWALTAGWVVLGLVTQWWWLYELWRFVPPSDFPP